MAAFKKQTSDRDRVCKICGDKIARNTQAVMLENVHVSPHYINMFFHEGCFFRSIADAQICFMPVG